MDLFPLAADPAPSSWAGIITAIASLFTACALVITAIGATLATRRTRATITENQIETTSRLDVIHTLVNSTLSAALQAQLDASRRELVLLLENTEMSERDGHVVSGERKAAIAALRRHVGDLSNAMRTRDDQTHYANMKIAEEADRKRRR